MSFLFHRLRQLSLLIVGLLLSANAQASIVINGALTFDLDGDAFANGADIAYIEGFAQSINPAFTYNTTQSFLEFAVHRSNAPAGRPAATPTTFNDLRATWVRPDSTGLSYGFNSNMALQSLTFDPSTVAVAGATGSARFTGGDSFWYANDSMIAPVAGIAPSIWIQYGNLDLTYDATRVGGGNSGWMFVNNLAGVLPTFDIRNLTINTTPNTITMSGDLFTTQEFRDGFGIQAGLDVGGFSFSGVTVVPEPSGLTLVGIAGLLIAQRRRRRLS